jgi:hypothetical protein
MISTRQKSKGDEELHVTLERLQQDEAHREIVYTVELKQVRFEAADSPPIETRESQSKKCEFTISFQNISALARTLQDGHFTIPGCTINEE